MEKPSNVYFSNILTFILDDYFDVIDSLRHYLTIEVDGNYLNTDNQIFVKSVDLKSFVLNKEKTQYYWLLEYVETNPFYILRARGE